MPYIKDSIELAKAGKAILEFVRYIRDYTSKKIRESNSETREGPWRTIEAMVNTAAKNECDLDFKYTRNNGEKMEARLTYTEANKVRRAEKVHRNGGAKKVLAVTDISAFAEQIGQLEPAA
jgi:hypothetical protein